MGKYSRYRHRQELSEKSSNSTGNNSEDRETGFCRTKKPLYSRQERQSEEAATEQGLWLQQHFRWTLSRRYRPGARARTCVRACTYVCLCPELHASLLSFLPKKRGQNFLVFKMVLKDN